MEPEHDLNLFGFFISDEKFQSHRNQPSPAMQDQQPQLPSTTLSLTIIPEPSINLFEVKIDIENPIETSKPKVIKKAKIPKKVIKKAKIPKKIIKRPRLGAPKPQPLPLKYRDFLVNNGVEEETLKLIMARTLTVTDVKNHNARLSMPRKQAKEGFLVNREEEWVNGKIVKGKRVLCKKLDVMVVDPSLGIQTMKFGKWNHKEPDQLNGKKKTSWWYALTNDWNKLVRENGLLVRDAIQVWSFRAHNGELGFLIHKMEELK